MKALIVFLVMLVVAQVSVIADWAPLAKPELIKYSGAIVIATLEKEISSEVTEHMKTQKVSFVVAETLKGAVGKRIVVNGIESSMCAPQVYFKTKQKGSYLLFLRKGQEKDYHVVNGDLGAMAITGKSVAWFKAGGKVAWPREPSPLKDVRVEVQNELKQLRRVAK